MLQPLSTDLYLASLPSLATVFGVPASTVQLTLSMFVAGFGGAQLVIGPLSDRYGRRPVLLAGLGLYVVASLLCAAAPGIDLLIVARFLQALGCCSAIIIARAIVRDAYAPADSARVIARASSWLSLAPLLGPILGSYLQVTFGWRAAFVAHSILGACLLAAVLLRLPETNVHKNPRATELAGLIENFRLVLGAREFWANALPGALSYGAIFAFISGSSLVLIRVLHVPTAWFGYCFAFGVSGYLGGTIVCRRLLPQLRPGGDAAHRQHHVAGGRRAVPGRARLRRGALVAGGRRHVPDHGRARRQLPGRAIGLGHAVPAAGRHRRRLDGRAGDGGRLPGRHRGRRHLQRHAVPAGADRLRARRQHLRLGAPARRGARPEVAS